MKRWFASVLSAWVLLGAAYASEPRVSFEGARNLAPNPSFENGLVGWNKAGEAEFAVDSEVKHTGKSSARIRVGAEASLRGRISRLSCR